MTEPDLERQRGNKVFSFEFNLPLKLAHVEKIEKGEDRLRSAIKCGNKTLVNRFGFLSCYDNETHELAWDIEKPGFDVQDVSYADELYLADNEGLQLHRLDTESGETKWSQPEHNSIRLITKETLVGITETDDEKELLVVRSKQDGKILWTHPGEYGFFGTILSENGILLVDCQKGCYAFEEQTGKQFWSYDTDSWQKKYRKRPVNPT